MSNNCQLSEVMNCQETFNNISNKCKVCADEHVLVNKPDIDYCFPLPELLACKEGEIIEDLQYGASLECKICKNGTSPISITNESAINKT